MTVILEKLAQLLGKERLHFFAPYVWIYKGRYASVIIKIEEMMQDNMLLVNASFARDGSGPLHASFLTMLLLEDSHATKPDSFGICSGKASVTLYHSLDATLLDEKHLHAYLVNFESLALCIFEQAVGSDAQSLQHISLSAFPEQG